jgi:flagellar basal-body rod protein FlgC
MDIISENLANANTTRTADGGPYKRKIILFQEREQASPFERFFEDALNRGVNGKGVRVSRVVKSQKEGALVYDPGHPDANADGYVEQANVNPVTEMVDLISASRSYEANITAMNATKAMINKTIEMAKQTV